VHKEKTRFILDQFLTRIRTLSKQIRSRYSNLIIGKDFIYKKQILQKKNFSDPECSHLWNELENSLSFALSYANDDRQFQSSLTPLRSEITELRK
jgi:hypothetical protein